MDTISSCWHYHIEDWHGLNQNFDVQNKMWMLYNCAWCKYACVRVPVVCPPFSRIPSPLSVSEHTYIILRSYSFICTCGRPRAFRCYIPCTQEQHINTRGTATASGDSGCQPSQTPTYPHLVLFLFYTAPANPSPRLNFTLESGNVA